MKQFCALMVLAAVSVFAADRYWLNPATADWTDVSAWQGGVAPAPADNLYFRYQADTVVTATQNMNIYRGYMNGKGTVTFDFAPGVVLLSSNHFAISQSASVTATGGRTLHLKSGILDLNTNKVFYMGDGTLLGTNALILSSPNSIIRNGTLQTATWSCGNRTVVSNGASLVNINLIVGNGLTASNNLFFVADSVLTNMNGASVGGNGSGNRYVSENSSFFMTVNKDFILGNAVGSTGNVAILRNSFMTNVYQLQSGFKGQKNTLVLSNSQVFVTYTAKAGADAETIPTGSSDNSIQILQGSLLYAANSVWLGDNARGDSIGRNRLLVSGSGSRLFSVGGITIGGKCSDNRLDVSDGGTVVCTNGNIVVGYGNLGGVDLYGCNRNVFTVTNGTIELGTTLTVGAAAFTGCASLDSLADIASDSVVNTRGLSNINGRNPGLIVGQSVRATNSVLKISSGSVFTNAYAIMVGAEGFRSRLVVDNAELVCNGGQSVIGEYAPASEGALVLLNQARFINNSASRLYVGIAGPANRFALTNATYTGNSLGMGGSASSSNNVLSAKDSQVSLVSAIFGDWGQRNLIALDNSQILVSGDVTVGYQPASTGNVVRLSGRNPLLWTDSLNIRNGAVLEFEVPKEGYAEVPIQCTAASGGSSNLTLQAANVWVKVSGKEFQQAGGGWVVLATNLNKTMNGSISLANCDLPEGSTLVSGAQYIAVRLPSTGGTVLRLY